MLFYCSYKFSRLVRGSVKEWLRIVTFGTIGNIRDIGTAQSDRYQQIDSTSIVSSIGIEGEHQCAIELTINIYLIFNTSSYIYSVNS